MRCCYYLTSKKIASLRLQSNQIIYHVANNGAHYIMTQDDLFNGAGKEASKQLRNMTDNNL